MKRKVKKKMNIQRINTYHDNRFSQKVLNQHGCFLVEGEPYEVEIISSFEAVIRGKGSTIYPELIEEFMFFTPHITTFYDGERKVVKEYPRVELLDIRLEEIQPSQFYVDKDKVAAVATFIEKGEDIIIQVSRYQDRYISLDGHTRLYYAVMEGFERVKAVLAETDDCIYDFVEEAKRRNITSPQDLKLLPHEEYVEKWHKYCDDYFSSKN